MAHNSRTDRFLAGTAEGSPVVMLPPSALGRLNSGDRPGSKVSEVLPSKRRAAGHAAHVEKVRTEGVEEPVTVQAQTLRDGHHRVAAATDARRLVPTRFSPV